MSKRNKLVAANWKMFKNQEETSQFLSQLINKLPKSNAQVAIAVPYVHLAQAVSMCNDTPVSIVSQNMHQEDKGAFTGEISASMLNGIGVNQTLIGHSERREYFFENDTVLKQKVNQALANQIKVIFCFGEKLDDRKQNKHFDLVKSQIEKVLFDLTPQQWQSSVVLAYEPVWAIGTGETASPEQAQEMHQFIRKTIAQAYDDNLANQVQILYGGSVKPDNAHALFSQADIDGGLVGGASLEVDSFLALIEAAQ